MKIDKLLWYFNRLRVMSPLELMWRLEQKRLEIIEKLKFSKKNISIIDVGIYGDNILKLVEKCSLEKNVINLIVNNRKVTTVERKLFGRFDYLSNGRIEWHKGFNTENKWPLRFAYSLSYKQKDEIGDARINWELNRHYHLTVLAKNYFISKNKKYVNELKEQFYDWCKENPFLVGISWTSVMEVAIRAFSWLTCLTFVESVRDSDDKQLCYDLKIGILNMIEYVSHHYSRYSSANNHLIIEMVMIGIVGVVFNNKKWIDLSLNILPKEFDKQTHLDGVNKEQSIHYHTFVMEALSLLIIVLRKNKIDYPKNFDNILERMCNFVADLIDKNGQIADIGDSDEGKLLNLTGREYNHYVYVLQIGSILLGKNYIDMKELNENIYYLFTEEEINKNRDDYVTNISKVYKDGGHTILKIRELNKERIMTVDHAPLGFGAIAAHGHADALSITLSVDGEKFIVDPGTYIYHIELPWRNYFRKTINHNTITINNMDQSEMKGAFLWGKRANARVLEIKTDDQMDELLVQHDGYKPIIHSRNIKYIKPDLFIIKDIIEGRDYEWILTYMIDSDIKLEKLGNQIKLEGRNNNVYLYINKENYSIDKEWQSKVYGSKAQTYAIRVKGNEQHNREIITIISINEPIKTVMDNDKMKIIFNELLLNID